MPAAKKLTAAQTARAANRALVDAEMARRVAALDEDGEERSVKDRFWAVRSIGTDSLTEFALLEIKSDRCPCCGGPLAHWTEYGPSGRGEPIHLIACTSKRGPKVEGFHGVGLEHRSGVGPWGRWRERVNAAA